MFGVDWKEYQKQRELNEEFASKVQPKNITIQACWDENKKQNPKKEKYFFRVQGFLEQCAL